MLLYIDTTSDKTAIAIFTTKLEEIGRQTWVSSKNQSEELLSEIDKLINGRKEELLGIFINIAPGSYTGSRVGVTTANFLGFALNIQPQGVLSEGDISFIERTAFVSPVLPKYAREPFITKKKDRL